MQEISLCPVCGGSDKKFIYGSTLSNLKTLDEIPNPYSYHYQINECVDCDLRFSSPIFENDLIHKLYSYSETGNIIEGEELNVKKTMFNYYKLVKPYLENKNRILDIGCDVGFLLEAALQDGFNNLYGCEPTPPARAVASQLPRSNISEKFYEELDFENDYFDFISMIHVLDHLIDPSSVLLKARRELKKDGILFAVVHNSKSVLGVLMGEKFPVYNLYHHYFFNKQTLKNLFESKGYKVLKILSTYNCYSLEFFINKVPFFSSKFKRVICALIKKLNLNRISINIPVGNIGVIAKKIH